MYHFECSTCSICSCLCVCFLQAEHCRAVSLSGAEAGQSEEEGGEDEEEKKQCTSAKFHFVDLAGSERAGRTGNVGERFKGAAFFSLLE